MATLYRRGRVWWAMIGWLGRRLEGAGDLMAADVDQVLKQVSACLARVAADDPCRSAIFKRLVDAARIITDVGAPQGVVDRPGMTDPRRVEKIVALQRYYLWANTMRQHG